jgi:hypothetical protein
MIHHSSGRMNKSARKSSEMLPTTSPMIQILKIAFFCTAAAQFTCAAPTWQQELSSPKPGPFPKLQPTSITLQVSWKGLINSGIVNIDFAPPTARKTDFYVVRSSARSVGAAASLFPYQSRFWSELDPVSLRPRYFQSVETDKRETATTTVRHSPDRAICCEVTQRSDTGKVSEKNRTFIHTPIFDIFSAMLHVRSQKLEVGDPVTLVICPFESPYLLRVKVISKEVHNGRNAIRLSVGMRKIDSKTLELLPYKKLKQDATLWLSDDADRIPIELRAAAFIGDVRATLVDHRKL